jgi:hypothetical protein
LHAVVTDLPEAEIQIGPAWYPWNRRVVRVVPTDFLQPIVLFGAQATLVNAAARAGSMAKSTDGYYLVVVVRDANKQERSYRTRFDGHSVWLGVRHGELTRLPAEVRQAWKEHLDDPIAGPLLVTPRDRTAEQWPERIAADFHIEARLVLVETKKVGGKDQTVEADASKVHPLMVVAPRDPSEVVQPLLLQLK